MVFGTFDGLHEGHLDFFRQAKDRGELPSQDATASQNFLIAVVARDFNVTKIKNRPAIRNENERLEILKKCDLVDLAVLGNEDNPYKIIQEIKPDIICLGYDQNSYNKNLEEKLKELGLNIEIYTLKPYKPAQFKSSIINKEIK